MSNEIGGDIRMGDMRRRHVLEMVESMESERALGIHDRSEESRAECDLRIDYFRGRLAKFQDDEDTLSQVERRDFGWTPSGYFTVREDSHIDVGEHTHVCITHAKARHLREALKYEKAKLPPEQHGIDYLESRLSLLRDENETLFELERRKGWLLPPRTEAEWDEYYADEDEAA